MTDFHTNERVMVFIPSETTGKNRKFARPYHGPYCIITITPTNDEIQLIERPLEPTIFVAIDRLRRCYPEQTDQCWTGHKKRRIPATSNKPTEESRPATQPLWSRDGPCPVPRKPMARSIDLLVLLC